MSAYQEIESNALQQLMEQGDVLLIDVRNDDEAARGIILGARHIPLNALAQSAPDLIAGETPLVFYCHSGIRSAQASRYFSSQGRENVFNLRGGILAWGSAGNTLVPKS